MKEEGIIHCVLRKPHSSHLDTSIDLADIEGLWDSSVVKALGFQL